MKLLIVNCVSDRSEIMLYQGLAQRGVQVSLFCDPRESRQAELRAAQIEVAELKIRSRFDWNAVKTIKQKLKSEKYDLVYAPTSRGLSATILATLFNPIPIATYRGTMGHLNPWLPHNYLAHLSSRVSAIICNCQAVQRYLASIGVSESKLFSIFKGHEIEWYQTKDKADLSKLGIPQQAFVVAWVANIRPVKGLDLLIKAAALIDSKYPIHYLIIGDGEIEKYKNMANQLRVADCFHFTGFRTDVKNLVAAANILALTSVDREGVPRSVIEALSQKIPVVVTAVGGLPEIVVNQKTGLVVPVSPEGISQAIRRYYENPDLLSEYGEHGQQDVLARFNRQIYIDRMLEVFNKISKSR